MGWNAPGAEESLRRRDAERAILFWLLVVTFLFVGSNRHGVRLDADGDHGGSYAVDQRGEARKRNRSGGLDCQAWLYGRMSKL